MSTGIVFWDNSVRSHLSLFLRTENRDSSICFVCSSVPRPECCVLCVTMVGVQAMHRQLLRPGLVLGSFKLDVATVMTQQGWSHSELKLPY